MTRKDFNLIAAALADMIEETKHEFPNQPKVHAWSSLIAMDFADRLADTNDRFDRARFLKACGVDQ